MADKVSAVRLLGFQDFFPNEEAKEMKFYANFVGKEMLSNYCCYFLSQLTHNHIPETPQLIQDWFTFMGRPHLYSPSYWAVIKEYDRIRVLFPSEALTVLSEESLLNMFQWANSNAQIVPKVEEVDASVMLHLIELNLIFNDDVLNNYQKAVDSANKYVDKIIYRQLLGTSYPQNDIINVDYVVLLFTQFYKLLRLLNFIEKTGMFQKLHKRKPPGNPPCC